MDFRHFLSELKKRNVVRVAGVYTVTAWGVFQVAKTIFETLDLPKGASALTLLLLALGLPIAVLVSWAFELGPDGSIRRASKAAAEEPNRRLNWMDWGALAAIATVVVVFAATAFGLAGSLGRDGGAGLRMGAPPSRSVAVLPFANFSKAADAEYFADGLTEEVTNSLAQVPDLKVAGRTSAFYFKGKNEDVREIGRKLNVAHVVEGSVRRSGDRLRVTCQLVSVKNGFHLWSETYDRTMDDAFAIQTEIADGVAEALKAELGAGGRPARPVPRDPEAYRLEVVAKGQVRQKGKAQLQSAQAIYRKLIEMEPDNAEVRADYAYATAYLAQNHLEGDFLPAVRDAERQIAKALALDPKSSSAYVAKGMLSAIRFIREGQQSAEGQAEAAFKRAVELAPRDSEALSLYGDFIAGSRPQEAVTYLRRALEIDPLDRVANNALAGSLFATDKLQEAELRYRMNVELFPEYVDSKEQLGDVLAEQGRLDQAVVWYRMAAAPKTDPAASIQLANYYYNLGMPREAVAALDDWREKPVIGPIIEAIKFLVAGDHQGLMRLAQAGLAQPEPDPVWRSGVVLAGAHLGQFDLAREQLLVTSPELFEPTPKVSPRLASDAVGAAYVIQQTGDQGQARRVLQAVLAATEPKPGLRQMNARRIARVKAYAMLGDKDRALAELRAAIDAGYRVLYDIDAFTRLDLDPTTQSLRGEPRFRAMIREVEASNDTMRRAILARTPAVASRAPLHSRMAGVWKPSIAYSPG
ncbi:MAG: tetratricopeptide repeat protein [Phenylobacterium sp.]|uniref:tetratricopeptide repeat protein n=1 Tax=Phenylobacterium sp. TaxID=1871053 RepID=UPI00273283EE|nr:tetratricopeptide repeat protein [Phenylobacterium sp.]MDP3749980.1 tetratricopeptide repeat protein [Phenylobacterium sp.]